MTETQRHAERLLELFRGAETHHGTYDHSRTSIGATGKTEIRAAARTVKEQITLRHWQQHLDGSRSLGVVPVREDSTCVFGCLDIDDYGVEHVDLIKSLERARLPLLVCQSKSGGAHAFLFLSEPAPAAAVRSAMAKIASSLGYAGSEVFPKQDTIAPDEEQWGSWLNMPYFGGDSSDRHCIKTNGMAMGVEEFVCAAEGARIRLEEVDAACEQLPRARLSAPATAGGAPTASAFRTELARLAKMVGNARPRNADNSLTAAAIEIGRWTHIVPDAVEQAEPRLRAAWAERGKDAYDFDRQWSRNVEAGKSMGPPEQSEDDGRYPEIEQIVVITGGEEDMWRLKLAGYGDITLSVKEIMNYMVFNTQCAARLGAVYHHMKVNDWNDRLHAARSVATFEAMPEDETIEYRMRMELRAFLNDRHRAETIDGLLLGKPFYDEDLDTYFFNYADFERHLRRGDSSMKNWTPKRIGDVIKLAVGSDNYKGTTKKVKGYTKGRGMPCKTIPGHVFEFHSMPEIPLPPLLRSVI